MEEMVDLAEEVKRKHRERNRRECGGKRRSRGWDVILWLERLFKVNWEIVEPVVYGLLKKEKEETKKDSKQKIKYKLYTLR